MKGDALIKGGETHSLHSLVGAGLGNLPRHGNHLITFLDDEFGGLNQLFPVTHFSPLSSAHTSSPVTTGSLLYYYVIIQ